MFHQAYGITASFFGFLNIRVLADDPNMNNTINYIFEVCKAKTLLTDQDIGVLKEGKDVNLMSINDRLIKTYSDDSAGLKKYTLMVFLQKCSDVVLNNSILMPIEPGLNFQNNLNLTFR